MGTVTTIQAPSVESFWRDYVVPQQPVVIAGLFQDAPLARLNTRAAARAALADMTLQFKGEYVEHFLDRVFGRPTDPRIGEMMRFDTYCDHVDRFPDTAGWMGQEKTPPCLEALFEVPAYCRDWSGGPDAGLMIHTFIGHPGKSASLHIDTDYKQVLVYEVYGRKRVYLIPARGCGPLHTAGFISRLDLGRLSVPEREALTAELGGCWTVLEPGDTLFLPFSYYHHFEYLDHAMSVNLRFGRNPYHQAFYRYMIPHWSLHALAALMVTPEDVCGRRRDLYAEMLDLLSEPAAGATARCEAVTAALETLARTTGAVADHTAVARRLAGCYYDVPEEAAAFLTRFRIDFQGCTWHRRRQHLAAWLEGPRAGKAATAGADTLREAWPSFARAGHVSLWVATRDLSALPPAVLRNEPWAGLWLRADFDCRTPEDVVPRGLPSPDGRPRPLAELLAEADLPPNVCAEALALAETRGVSAASLLVVLPDTAYDGRVEGNAYLRFLGAFAVAPAAAGAAGVP